MRFKYEGNQKVWIAKHAHPVTIVARTEFFSDRQPRYCVESETHIPGKNMNQDWINEDQLTSIEPAKPEPVATPEPVKVESKRRPGIRKKGLTGR